MLTVGKAQALFDHGLQIRQLLQLVPPRQAPRIFHDLVQLRCQLLKNAAFVAVEYVEGDHGQRPADGLCPCPEEGDGLVVEIDDALLLGLQLQQGAEDGGAVPQGPGVHVGFYLLDVVRDVDVVGPDEERDVGGQVVDESLNMVRPRL